ncbi:MAG: FAD-dependent oxidoreductase [Acidimicrobiales bacterium]
MTNRSADVVIVGYGAAGIAAAVTANDAGASVLVLEKNPESNHTPNTRMSGGMVMVSTDSKAATEYLDACADGMVAREISAVWAARATELADWMAHTIGGLDMAAAAGAEHASFPGADSIVAVQPGGVGERLSADAGAGPALFAGLHAAAARRGIEVLWNQPARRLITDNSGAVTGVQIDHGVVSATKAVILCSGGYEYDEDLKRDNLRTYPVYFYGNPGNTGDGVHMAQAVGASMWHMNQMIGRAIGHFEQANGSDLNVLISIGPPGYVITDRFGERFANEHNQELLRHDFYYDLLLFDPGRNLRPRVPCYWFFDEARLNAGPLTLTHIGAPAVGIYDWSDDNSTEVERGWISRGDTIAEAAEAAGLDDPDAAARTIAEYNDACDAGQTDPLGRPPESMIPIEGPPFYCVPLWPGGSNTTGGPRRNAHAQILDPFDDPIPGLYAAGELGQASGLLYPADGSNLSEALCFGQIAAEHALGI